MREGLGFHFDIEVNGCCNERTYAELIGMGAETLVMGGSGLFFQERGRVLCGANRVC